MKTLIEAICEHINEYLEILEMTLDGEAIAWKKTEKLIETSIQKYALEAIGGDVSVVDVENGLHLNKDLTVSDAKLINRIKQTIRDRIQESTK